MKGMTLVYLIWAARDVQDRARASGRPEVVPMVERLIRAALGGTTAPLERVVEAVPAAHRRYQGWMARAA